MYVSCSLASSTQRAVERKQRKPRTKGTVHWREEAEFPLSLGKATDSRRVLSFFFWLAKAPVGGKKVLSYYGGP